jgi:hypothetical protein
MKVAFEAGRWTRPAPIGYKNVDKKLQLKGGPSLEPDHRESELIRKAFQLVEAGHNTTADVLRTLTELGLRSKKGNKLTLHAFLELLRNPLYIGKIQSRKWRKTVQGLQQAIVNERIFSNVQLILKGKKPVAAPYQRNTGAKAVIPPKSNRKQQREYDKELYKKRNRIERCFSRLKQFRRFATRYDKIRACFQAFVALACSTILLSSIVDTA